MQKLDFANAQLAWWSHLQLQSFRCDDTPSDYERAQYKEKLINHYQPHAVSERPNSSNSPNSTGSGPSGESPQCTHLERMDPGVTANIEDGQVRDDLLHFTVLQPIATFSVCACGGNDLCCGLWGLRGDIGVVPYPWSVAWHPSYSAWRVKLSCDYPLIREKRQHAAPAIPTLRSPRPLSNVPACHSCSFAAERGSLTVPKLHSVFQPANARCLGDPDTVPASPGCCRWMSWLLRWMGEMH